MRIAIRADGAAFMGGGHVSRCLALADALSRSGADCLFVSRQLTDSLERRIRGSGHTLVLLPHRKPFHETDLAAPSHANWLAANWQDDALDTIEAIGEPCDWLVVDHYALDARWHSAVRSMARRILVIDDLADRPLACDALLDPNYRQAGIDPFANLVPRSCHRFLSPQMALLDPSFATANKRARIRETLRRVFVYLGTVTAERHHPILDALAATDLVAEIVGSSFAMTDPRTKGHPVVASGQVRLWGPQPSLLPFMERADLAIGPIGTSTWERCALGLPTLAITIAANQEIIATNLAGDQIIDLLGPIEVQTADDYFEGLQRMRQGSWLKHQSIASLSLCDGAGVNRMVEYMLPHAQVRGKTGAAAKYDITLRKATPSDARLLYDWRNHPSTRTMSINKAPIDWDSHVAWLNLSLADHRRLILIGQDSATHESIGTIRLDRSDDTNAGEISFAIAPEFRGRGYGFSILTAGIAEFEKAGVHTLSARVLISNPASQTCFRKAGFHLSGCDSTTLLYRNMLEPK